MTTSEFAIRFILTCSPRLKIPPQVMTSPGRKKDSNSKALAIEQFLILHRTGTRFPEKGGLNAAARVVYEMVGGRIELDSICRHIAKSFHEAYGR
ncbi:hypothetical protein MTBLM5_450026 [Magnetospirillum sp. LM-5]|nr:hypothetical protein MTBLM5_450026 [Magnetospirillum sp. LM-5]